jgi:uncharacterized protein YecT (DUF1311 family)
MRLRWLLLTVCPLAIAGSDATWLLSYQGQSANNVIWDMRTDALLKVTLPQSLAEPLTTGALGGPPGPVHVVDRRYVSLSACVPHYCPSKGFFWIDTHSGAAIGAYYEGNVDFGGQRVVQVPPQLKLGSLELRWRDVPMQARRALKLWMIEEGVRPQVVTYDDGGGTVTTLPVAEVAPRPRFEPPESGPSFDCNKAQGAIEKALCEDAKLAKTDLELWRLYSSVWHGCSTEPDRVQLETFQRSWKLKRDSDCGLLSVPTPCLMDSYARQAKELGDWLPHP